MSRLRLLVVGLLYALSGQQGAAFGRSFTPRAKSADTLVSSIVVRGGARNGRSRLKTMATSSDGPSVAKPKKEVVLDKKVQAKEAVKKLDLFIAMTYFCNTVMFMLPVILLPVIGAENGGGAGFVAAIASVATLGGASGKFVNGFICQAAGAKISSALYLMASSLCCFLLSATTLNMGLLLAGIEFCASVQWTASAVILTNHYKNDPAALAQAITLLSLSSTAGGLITKVAGPVLLQYMSWQQLARVGGGVGLLGALTMSQLVRQQPEGVPATTTPLEFKSIFATLGRVVGSPLFWLAGVGHSMVMLAKTSDKILGSFFQEATGLSSSICGGLTLSITIGMVVGLVTGSKAFFKQDGVPGKTSLLKRRYGLGVLSAFVLAGLAALPTNKIPPLPLAGLIALFSGSMATMLSFQYYQLPPIIARSFGQDQAVCLSFLDGIGYFLASPIWAATSSIVKGPGWAPAWVMLGGLFLFGGTLMLKALPPILKKQEAK
uniref:Major facilitator superfamily (MFS) profile domain-containing protein n=1 Tax=Grammatophora oceanica TaxID=210454 RepID=A0A7S1UKU6_9STRA|mmetsp:Transcript_10434/g.15196  ORF Transcript_10434/g.15196 Transcript_10434/m.15196 type:complete len:492 (+) Transcript_10434:131-1606(+)